ncbi:MAG: extracellular solute-binding protein [Boseongicola sp.]|nr:extracellular solute-binding protein [Boseongicola sp.]
MRIFILAIALSAFGGIAAQADIVVWHSYRGAEKAALEQVAENFNAQSDTKVELQAVPHDAYADKITAAVPRGQGPDAFIFAQDRIGGWVATGGLLEPLTFLVEPEELQVFDPALVGAMTFEDEIYAFPLNFKMPALYYNKALVQDPPETTDDLRRMAAEMKGSDSFGFAYAYDIAYYHSALMNGFGGGVFGADGAPTLDSEGNAQSVDWIRQFAREEALMPQEPTSAVLGALFNQGKLGMLMDGPWFAGSIDPSVDFGVAALPTIDESGNPMRPWMTVEGLFLSMQRPDTHDVSMDFARFLTSAEQAYVMASVGRQLPSNRAVFEHDDIASDPIMSGFFAQLSAAEPMPNRLEMSLVWGPLDTALKGALTADASAVDALSAAQNDVLEGIANLKQAR